MSDFKTVKSCELEGYSVYSIEKIPNVDHIMVVRH